MPPLQGGAAGLLSYDLGRSLEEIPSPAVDEFQIPQLAIGLYDTVLAWDHAEDHAWIISHGWPESDDAARVNRARLRIEQFESWLRGSANCEAPGGDACSANGTISREQLAPQFPADFHNQLTSNFSHQRYLQAAEQAIEYIHAGDVFQVNLAQRLLHPDDGDPVSLYLRLRNRNPATFAGYFAGENFQIASASPERFLKLNGRNVETRPIKGTRRRNPLPEADLFTQPIN